MGESLFPDNLTGPDDPLTFVRAYYGVPAYIGRRVKYTGWPAPFPNNFILGTIMGAYVGDLIVMIDPVPGASDQIPRGLILNPKQVEYLNQDDTPMASAGG